MCGQVGGIVGPEKQPPVGVCHEFGKCSMVRQHDRYPVRPGLKNWQTLTLLIHGRCAKNLQRLKKVYLPRSVQLSVIGEFARQTPPVRLLPHLLEVASIARTIGRALRLNEDLIEALALLHDIGHPPFGHAGEDVLDQCLADVGGFSHNQYALCLVEELEVRYPNFPGLNLTFEVLEGQASRVKKSDYRKYPMLEVQVVDIADSVTYDSHDTDDAVALGLVTLDELLEISLVREAMERVRNHAGQLRGEMLRKAVVHELIDWQVGDVLAHSGSWLSEHQPTSVDDVQKLGFRLAPGRDCAAKKAELETFLHERVYRHAQLSQQRARAQSQLRNMFEGYVKQVELLPQKFQMRIDQVGLHRTVGEYIAGMTDRFCEQQYQRNFAGSSGGDSSLAL